QSHTSTTVFPYHHHYQSTTNPLNYHANNHLKHIQQQVSAFTPSQNMPNNLPTIDNFLLPLGHNLSTDTSTTTTAQLLMTLINLAGTLPPQSPATIILSSSSSDENEQTIVTRRSAISSSSSILTTITPTSTTSLSSSIVTAATTSTANEIETAESTAIVSSSINGNISSTEKTNTTEQHQQLIATTISSINASAENLTETPASVTNNSISVEESSEQQTKRPQCMKNELKGFGQTHKFRHGIRKLRSRGGRPLESSRPLPSNDTSVAQPAKKSKKSK
ncbi:unnamed protein product, partial [Didymodactylos carnosus]